MKAKLGIGLRYQFCLEGLKDFEPGVYLNLIDAALVAGKRNVVFEMTRFRSQQSIIEALEPIGQQRCEHRKTLTGAGLN